MEINKQFLKDGLKIALNVLQPNLFNKQNTLIYINLGSKRQVSLRQLYGL